MHMLPAEAKVNAAAALPPPAAEPAAAAAAARDGRDGARAAPGALSCARERAANEVRRGAREAAGAGEGGGRLSPRGGHAGAAVVRQSSVPVISARPRVQAGPFPTGPFHAAAPPAQRVQSRPESPSAPTAPTAPKARPQRHAAEVRVTLTLTLTLTLARPARRPRPPRAPSQHGRAPAEGGPG